MIKWILLGWALTIGIGVGGYYGWMALPPEWRAKVAGWKTNGLAALVAFAPDGITILTQLQAMSDLYEPSPTVNIVMKMIAGAIFALRFITSREQKEEL